MLTKLDGTAKGGVVLAIKNDLKVPVKFVGVGEQIDDLQPFNPEAFASGLFDNEVVHEEGEEKDDFFTTKSVLDGITEEDLAAEAAAAEQALKEKEQNKEEETAE